MIGIQLSFVGFDAIAEGLGVCLGARRLGGELLVELRAASNDALLGLLLDALGLGVGPVPDPGHVGLRGRLELLAATLGIGLEAANPLLGRGAQVGEARLASLLRDATHGFHQVAHEPGRVLG